MQPYHKVEIASVVKRDPTKKYWTTINPVSGGIDLCSTDTNHPEYKKKQESINRKRKEEVRKRREARMIETKIRRAKKIAQEAGLKISE